MKPERIFRSTRIAHGLVRYSHPPQAITLSPSRRSGACIIAMSVELRKMGEAARCCLCPNRAKSNFEQGQGLQVARISPAFSVDARRNTTTSTPIRSLARSYRAARSEALLSWNDMMLAA